jgi:dihydroxynaphthoic acid synthetase
MKFQDILFEHRDGIARITLNMPDRLNAFSEQTLVELTEVFEAVGANREIGVVVLTGAGDRAFCAGGYLADLQNFNAEMGRKLFGGTIKALNAIRRVPQPVIAAVNGHAIGGGNELVIACDLAIASDRAKLGQSGPKVGSSPVFGGTNLAALNIGEKRVKEVCMMCQQYTAQEAYEMGWVNKVVPHEKLFEEVDAWCQELLDRSPAYLELTKVTSNIWWDFLQPAYVHAEQAMIRLAGGPEMVEGSTAFMSKRKPDFRKFRRN